MTTEDHVEQVLAERARLLARPLQEPDSTAADEVAVLEAAGARYAVDLTSVERVHPVTAVTPLPGLRPPWAGLVSLRGEILPALDLPAYLGRPGTSISRVAHCAVVAHGGLRVALLSETPVVVVGLPDDRLTILDVPSILADPALVVDD